MSKKKLFVPADILRTFKAYFPDVEATKVAWSWEVPYKIYEAEFEHEGKQHEVEITVTGHLLLTETNISLEDVPDALLDIVQARYPDYLIEEAELVEWGNDDMYYEFNLKHKEDDSKTFEAQFREDGMFVAKGEDL
jgi:hypothetical protein